MKQNEILTQNMPNFETFSKMWKCCIFTMTKSIKLSISGITFMQSYFWNKVQHQICCLLHLSESLFNCFWRWCVFQIQCFSVDTNLSCVIMTHDLLRVGHLLIVVPSGITIHQNLTLLVASFVNSVNRNIEQ